jgi:hypothetical protein
MIAAASAASPVWCIHKTLRVFPAMAAGISDTLMSMEDVAEMVEAAGRKPGKRGPYKKRVAAAAGRA